MSQERVHQNSLPTSQIVNRYATLDIETSGIDPSSSQTVAIGIGLYDALLEHCSVDVLTYGGGMGSEAALLRRAFERINDFDPKALVTYNGDWFDLEYLEGRIERLTFEKQPRIECADHHIDLFLPRKERASEAGVKWPKLEEVLQTHNIPVHVTEWRGKELTNGRFGESLAPEYIEAVDEGQANRVQQLESLIYEYTATDIEANIALYEADAGRHYEPVIPV